MKIDFRWIEIRYELWALGEHLGVIERQLETIGKQERDRIFAELHKQGWDNDEAEVDIARQEADELTEHIIPRYFRSSYLVTLWAVFESAIIEVAAHLQKKKGLAISVRDIKGHTSLESAEKYFRLVLNFPLFAVQQQSRERIEMLRVLRNAIAHGNGRRDAIGEKQWKKIERWRKAGIGVDLIRDDYVSFSRSFVEETYRAVNEFVRDLIERAKSG